MTVDLRGDPIRVGNTVRAFVDGDPFLARITRIDPGEGFGGTDRLILKRLDNGQRTARDSDAVYFVQD